MKQLLTFDKSEQMTLREQLAHIAANPGSETGLFYDWFCRETSLTGKSAKLAKRLRTIAESPRFDQDRVYAFFKNVCGDRLYDQIKICDFATQDVLFCVEDHAVFSATDLSIPAVTGMWRDIVKWFNDICPSCKANPKTEPHTCPFAEDIHGDSQTLCTCCAACEHECAMDI